MSLLNWFCDISSHPTATRRRQSPSSQRPRLEWLEDRLTPTTFIPTSFSDGVSGGGAVNTLRDAILAANNDTGTATDTIQLAAGTYTLSIANTSGHDTTGAQGDLNINNGTHSLVIQGVTDANGKPATVIDQTVADRVFQIVYSGSGTTITFQNLLIEGGDAQEDGGFYGAGFTSALGGGILDDQSNVTLSNVVVQSNQAQAGAGFNAEGGGIYVDSGVLTVNNSVIQNNSAFGGTGTSTGPSGSHAYGGGVAFDVFGGTNQLSISNSTVANNLAQGGDGFNTIPISGGGGSARGGGIETSGGSSFLISITASTLSGNRAVGGDSPMGDNSPGSAEGGGADLQGAIQLVNSTIAGNSATAGFGISSTGEIVASGGGLSFVRGWNATLINVTVTGNNASLSPRGSGAAAVTEGGGIDNGFATVTLTNTLVAFNSATLGTDYDGSVNNSDHNLIGNAEGSSGFSASHGDLLGTTASPLQPLLGPLANNGGPTQTSALLPGSPALNAGDNNVLSITGSNDQRGIGYPRVVGSLIDIGAFEVQTMPPSPPPSPPPPSSGGPSPRPTPPPTLQIPPLLALIDSLLGGVETVNVNGTETIVDRLFDIPLLVSTFDSAGNLMSVDLLGFDITFLFG